MQQGTNFIMPVDFTGVDLDGVEKIEFVFKAENSPSAPAFKTAAYPGDAVRSDTGNRILITWTAAETYAVPGGAFFYMGTRLQPSGSVWSARDPCADAADDADTVCE